MTPVVNFSNGRAYAYAAWLDDYNVARQVGHHFGIAQERFDQGQNDLGRSPVRRSNHNDAWVIRRRIHAHIAEILVAADNRKLTLACVISGVLVGRGPRPMSRTTVAWCP
jgi:hypothetical protein